MVFFKYGFIFLAGAALGTAMAHRGQHHRHGHCWRRRHGGDRGRWHEQEAAQPASYGDEKYQQHRRGGVLTTTTVARTPRTGTRRKERSTAAP
ncbi:hypothetical protein BDA96_07G047700 [Sorghum bicolor]|uniref:Secreted protein n=2 Tax=Sorghum bicolor TaxID=4558 RepID=A0A921QIH5_SORBI|nr:hypothetical protein BDA96_07G047700 [Sorghum bicolor]KXG24457.1 hypothetical protein SORBI_3007G044800 [Sorghum bicolor]